MTDPIKARIRELVPQAIQRGARDEFLYCPITLAVVLRAIGKLYNSHAYMREPAIIGEKIFSFSLTDRPDIIIYWNLEHDYDQQSEECKQFIGSLLGV